MRHSVRKRSITFSIFVFIVFLLLDMRQLSASEIKGDVYQTALLIQKSTDNEEKPAPQAEKPVPFWPTLPKQQQPVKPSVPQSQPQPAPQPPAVQPQPDQSQQPQQPQVEQKSLPQTTAPQQSAGISKFSMKKGEVSFYFDDADVFSVIQTIFGDVLKVNYVIDPRVKGRVNFRSVEPVAKENILPLMEVMLRLNGIGIVDALVKHFVRFSDLRIKQAREPHHEPAQNSIIRCGAKFLRGQGDKLFPGGRVWRGGDMPGLIPGRGTFRELQETPRGVRRIGKGVRDTIVHEPRGFLLLGERLEDQEVGHAGARLRAVEIGTTRNHSGESAGLPLFD